MKKISCVILGYGDRSSRYADYARQVPNELEVVGVIDVNELQLAKNLLIDKALLVSKFLKSK